jgi:transcription initiation factor IIF auxiliary subunit
MDFNQTALELEKHRAYLNEISKEDIVHIIKSVIFHLEQKKKLSRRRIKKNKFNSINE